MTDEEIAGQYFDEFIAPNLEAVGTPAEGIAHLRQKYSGDIVRFKHMDEIRAWWEAREQ